MQPVHANCMCKSTNACVACPYNLVVRILCFCWQSFTYLRSDHSPLMAAHQITGYPHICVPLHQPNSLVACRCIKVVDTRNSSGRHQEIAGAHGGCVNCVRWHPRNPHVLLSTATDSCLHLWDLRHTQQPVFSFQGHTLMSR